MKEILGLVPSKEQWDIINAIGRKENVSVEAVAGASKSSTLMMSMKTHSNLKFLVLTFMSALNKGMQQECLDNGIHNAAVSTVHSLAYKEIIGKERRYTIGGYVEYKMVADYSKLGFYAVKEAKKMYEDWLDNTEPVEALPEWAQRMHKFIMSRDRISHQMYFKAYIIKILEGEVSFDHFDYVVVDEANDASRGMAQILKSCGVKTIMLGDPHQSVLGFTLKGYSAYQDEKLLSKYTRYPLSQSFRCSPEVAKYAKAFLNAWLDPDIEFRGFADTVKFADKSYMVLCRTNAGMLKEMVKLMEKGKSFKCNKPLRDLFVPVYQLLNINANVGKVRALNGTVTAEDLIKAGMKVNKGTELCTGVEYYFNGGAKDSGMKFAKYVKRYMSNEFMVAASIIAEHAKTKGAIKRLEERIKSHMSQRSKITVLTASSSKGMTATRVSISGFRDYSDILLPLFKPEMDMADETEQRYKHVTVEELLYRLRNGTRPEEVTAREEMNLLYVAITRCRIGFSFSKNDFDPNILLSPKLVVEGLNKELETLSTILGRR